MRYGLRRSSQILVAITALAVPAATGAAAIPVLSVGSACYVNSNPSSATPITATGSGWTPGDSIAISGGRLHGTATVGADGTFTQTIAGLALGTAAPAQRRVILTATDETAAGADQQASTPVQIANLAVATRPAAAAPSKRVIYSFSGFLPDQVIYEHILHRGKVVSGASYGTASAPCGMRRQTSDFYPGGHPRYSRYTVQFDDVRHYSRLATPRIVTTLSITGY